MHVGFVSLESPVDGTGLGGIAAYLRAIIPAYLEAGHRVTVITKAGSEGASDDVPAGFRLVTTGLPNLHWYARRSLPIDRSAVVPLREVEWSLGFYRAVRRVHAQDPFDVIETNETACELLALRPPAPLVIRLHGSDFFFRKHTGEKLTWGIRATHRLQMAALRRARLVTVPSKYHADMVARELGLDVPAPTVIPNPLLPEFLRDVPDYPRGAHAGPPTILSVGRLSTVKGTEHLVAALNDVVFPSLQARVLLAGPWQLDRSPHSLGVMVGDSRGTGIHWLGPVPQHDLPGLYSESDIFVMPSMYETYGLSALEAMAFGMPVVASAAGALTELIEDGVNGLLVPPANVRSLGNALLRLLNDQELSRRLGSGARRRAMEINTQGAAQLAVRTLEAVARESRRSAWTTSKTS